MNRTTLLVGRLSPRTVFALAHLARRTLRRTRLAAAAQAAGIGILVRNGNGGVSVLAAACPDAPRCTENHPRRKRLDPAERPDGRQLKQQVETPSPARQ